MDPAGQYAFYDPGIGVSKGAHSLLGSAWDSVYHVACQMTGLGRTNNIIDCYAALVRNWRPGDRVFLFGFGHGAYTVRCLGAAIALCGIPTIDGNQPLKRDMKTSKRIAKEAVKRVYQHTHSRPREQATQRQKEQMEQRLELADRFRAKYRSGDSSGANVYPHFIGVFDTVAPVAYMPRRAINWLVILALNFIGFWDTFIGLWDRVWPRGLDLDWSIVRDTFAWPTMLAALVNIVVALIYVANLIYRVRWEVGLRHSRWWRPFHLLDWRMRFYDRTLSPKVQYARHALAIDERRKDFDRVGWATRGEHPERPRDGPEWIQQIWFSGSHSDIGGSYPEEESRLSDIPLKWMLEAAVSVGLKYDTDVLKLYPDPTGMQHDETRSLPFKSLAKIDRLIPVDAPLHPSVIERFKAKDVLQHDVDSPYRPEGLRKHALTAKFY